MKRLTETLSPEEWKNERISKHNVVVLIGPSGSGKTTISEELQKKYKRLNDRVYVDDEKELKYEPAIKKVVTCTSRLPRTGEKDAVNYFFKTKKEFVDDIASGKMLEYAIFPNPENIDYKNLGRLIGAKAYEMVDKITEGSNFYGTLESKLMFIRRYTDALAVLEVEGAKFAKKKFGEKAIVIYIDVDINELKKRIKSRDNCAENAERIANLESEIAAKEFADYVVVNNDLEKSVNEIINILSKHTDYTIKQ